MKKCCWCGKSTTNDSDKSVNPCVRSVISYIKESAKTWINTLSNTFCHPF